jgi:Skp family chaperone for outer membrane proteins
MHTVLECDTMSAVAKRNGVGRITSLAFVALLFSMVYPNVAQSKEAKLASVKMKEIEQAKSVRDFLGKLEGKMKECETCLMTKRRVLEEKVSQLNQSNVSATMTNEAKKRKAEQVQAEVNTYQTALSKASNEMGKAHSNCLKLIHQSLSDTAKEVAKSGGYAAVIGSDTALYMEEGAATDVTSQVIERLDKKNGFSKAKIDLDTKSLCYCSPGKKAT